MAVFPPLSGLLSWWNGGGPAKLDGGQPRPMLHLDRDVGPYAALSLSTVWSCVRLLAETTGTLPLGVYRKDAQGRRSAANDHGLYGLIHDSPNADQSGVEFWEAAVACLALHGNFYAEKTVGVLGSVVSLDIMAPERTSPYRAADGSRRYRYYDRLGRYRDLGEAEVFHLRGFGLGHDVGLSPLGLARQSLSVAMTANETAEASLRNGVRPSGWLVVPAKSTPEQKKSFKELFLDPVTGPGATAKAGVLEMGVDWKDMSGMPAEDMQLLQTRAFHVEEICRWFRIPPFMVGHTEKSTSWGTGLEQQMIGFLTFSLRPYLRRIEQAVRKQLMTDADRAQGVYAEFNLEGPDAR